MTVDYWVTVVCIKMFSFEGDYRRKPQQNLAGASKRNEKSVLLQHAHLERMKREDIRRRNNAALKIQAYTRSFLIRQSIKRKSRQEFDNARSQQTVKFITANGLVPYIKNFLFFYQPTVDLQRFNWLLEQVLANKKDILVNNIEWSWRIKYVFFFYFYLSGNR